MPIPPFPKTPNKWYPPVRWTLLTMANLACQGALLIWLVLARKDGFDLQVHYFAWMSLGLPLSLLRAFLPSDWFAVLWVVVMFVNPVLWATMIELGLRRFVDPPKDSDTG